MSRPTYLGGLGFGFKWNMGWMHDTLGYFQQDPIHRRYHHNELTFSLIYAFSENFILPLSHDEVVHGKGSLYSKMPGDHWQKLANLRALYGYMWAHPGKKLLFMGCEFAQYDEWRHDQSLPWHLLENPDHAGVQALVRELNRVYKSEPALYELDNEPGGFWWLEPNDVDNNVFAFVRASGGGYRCVVCIANLSPVPREGYRLGLPRPGRWREVVNTDSTYYGGARYRKSRRGRDGADRLAWTAAVRARYTAAAGDTVAGSRRSADPFGGFIAMKSWCGRVSRFRSVRIGTAVARTSLCSASTRSACELCLFDEDNNETRIDMTERRALNWHCYLPDIGPGQRYGYRVYGPYGPQDGHRFNPAKLLIDPYAQAIDGVVDWAHDANVLPYVPTGAPDADLEIDDEDDAEAIPKAVVIDDAFFWEGDRPPRVPFADTVIYETHVRGFTMLHPDVREDLRGTYAGLASDPAIGYLKDLGVTAVELLPVHHICDESFLAERGLTQLLGLQHDRLPRAALRVRRDRHARRAGARVQGHGEGAAPRTASR